VPASRRVPENLRLDSTISKPTDMSKLFNIDCQLDYDVDQQTVFVFNVAVSDDECHRVVTQTTDVAPDSPMDEFRDPAGINRYTRIDAAPGEFTIRYRAAVEIDLPAVDPDAPQLAVANLPGPVLTNLRASRYCESDQLFAFAMAEFGQLPPNYTRVQAISDWIHDNIAYQVGSSTLTTTAQDVLANRAGVCRDFAHLGIAFCRALNIPARFVTSYAVYQEPPADFHAVFEAYLGDRWYLFDPTRLAKLDEMVRIGTGIDASEVPFTTFFGSARLRRLSPLIEPARLVATTEAQLPSLQQADSGIQLAA
jgi:transglutaminase-like putative cysteine protease